MIAKYVKFRKAFGLISCLIVLNSCASKSINIDYDGHVYIKTTINDTVFGNFLYDTGASNFILDSTFVAKNKFQFKNERVVEIVGVGNNTKRVKLVNDKLYFNVDEKYNYSRETYLVDLKIFMGQNIDGILGVRTFKDRPHKIDFIKKKLTFTEKHKNYDSIKFTYNHSKIYVPLDFAVNKKRYSGKFILDLGSAVTVLNSTNTIDIANEANYISLGGIGGETSGKSIFVDSFKLGNKSLTNYIIDFSQDTSGALADKNFTGLLGNDILDNFDIIIDLQKEMLYLKPNEKYNKHNKFLYKSFSYMDNTAIDKSWVVNYLYLDTDAYRKGLRLNDKILEIDGVKVTNLSRVKFYKSLKLNQELKLKIETSGEIKEINLILNKFLGK